MSLLNRTFFWSILDIYILMNFLFSFYYYFKLYIFRPGELRNAFDLITYRHPRHLSGQTVFSNHPGAYWNICMKFHPNGSTLSRGLKWQTRTEFFITLDLNLEARLRPVDESALIMFKDNHTYIECLKRCSNSCKFIYLKRN